jgi:hypothetical protein
MKTLEKLLILAAVFTLVTAAFYQGHRLSQLNQQLQASQRASTLLTDQLKQLQRQRDEATNLLAAARDEVAALKSQKYMAELLKLRGEVTQLRQQLAFSEAKAQAPFGGLAQLFSDPAMKDYLRKSSSLMTQSVFSDLFKELKLTPEQSKKTVQILSDTMLDYSEKLYEIPKGTVSPADLAKSEQAYLADQKTSYNLCWATKESNASRNTARKFRLTPPSSCSKDSWAPTN